MLVPLKFFTCDLLRTPEHRVAEHGADHVAIAMVIQKREGLVLTTCHDVELELPDGGLGVRGGDRRLGSPDEFPVILPGVHAVAAPVEVDGAQGGPERAPPPPSNAGEKKRMRRRRSSLRSDRQVVLPPAIVVLGRRWCCRQAAALVNWKMGLWWRPFDQANANPLIEDAFRHTLKLYFLILKKYIF